MGDKESREIDYKVDSAIEHGMRCLSCMAHLGKPQSGIPTDCSGCYDLYQGELSTTEPCHKIYDNN